jgi:hypothetical protein
MRQAVVAVEFPVEFPVESPAESPVKETGTEPEAVRVGPVDWALHKGDRAVVSCHYPAQWDALSGLLTGLVKPLSGSLEEIGTVTVQTDSNLKNSLDLNRSIGDYLHSPDAPEFVWLEKRRKVLGVLLDRLEISPSMTRRPLKHESQAVRDKFWALRFMVSRAQLLLGSGIFRLPDASIRAALALRWGDFPGALIVEGGAPGASFPGILDTRVEVDEQGRVSVRSLGGNAGRGWQGMDAREDEGE